MSGMAGMAGERNKEAMKAAEDFRKQADERRKEFDARAAEFRSGAKWNPPTEGDGGAEGSGSVEAK
jgi:hypothetical protein